MKKRISKLISLILATMTVMAVSISANAVEPVVEPLTPTADTTLGDICRHFEPEWFSALPNDIQKLYDETLLQESSKKTNDNTSRDIVLADYLDASVDITNVTNSSIDYRGRIMPTSPLAQIDYPAMLLTVAIYNADGDVVDSDSSYEANTRMCTISGSFTGLYPKYRYRVEAIGLITPPDGYFIPGPIYSYTHVTTK